ncbi:hypothetical protein L208DRAFT_1321553 [Tricholoma matsutake]|nr:hypothetical protein L208DRAFT_1321553 [Tricholoma matsutake 945]
MEGEVCESMHLLSHTKGDTYITTYTQCHSHDRTGGDIVWDIDSVWNSLFLNSLTHIRLGKHIAFLMVCATHHGDRLSPQLKG